MIIRIYIDDIEVEGVSPSAFKLTINNADPIKFTERTSSFSASVKVPRTESNDRIFKRERAPWLFTRKKPYSCKVSFDGMKAPIGSGSFKVTVTASEDGYSLSFIENAVKFSTVSPAIYHDIRPRFDNSSSTFGFVSLTTELQRLYRNVVMPVMDPSQVTELLYTAEIKPVEPDRLVNLAFRFVPYKAFDGASKAIYTGHPSMVIDNSSLATGLVNCVGSHVTMTISQGSYIIKPPTYTEASAKFKILPAEGTFTFDVRSVMPDGNIKYEAGHNINVGFTIPAGLQDSVYILNTDSIFIQEDLPVLAASNIVGTFTSISAPTRIVSYLGECGFSSGTDIVEAICKTFCWTYDFEESTGTVTMRHVIAPDAITDKDSPNRIAWKGAVKNVKTSKDISGLGRTMQYKVGELEYRFAAYQGSVEAVTDAAVSSLPVTKNFVRPRADLYVVDNMGVQSSDFFRNPTKYGKMLTDYYKLFAKGYELEVEAEATYFDIASFKPSACYRFAGLNDWYYIRSIKNWNPENNTATFNLIALDLIGAITETLPIPSDPIIRVTPLGNVTIT